MLPYSIHPFFNLNRIDSLSSLNSSFSKEERELKPKDAKEICSEFESIFIRHLLQQMRKTLPKSDFLDGGITGEFFNSQWDETLAQKIAEGGGIGLGNAIYSSLFPNSLGGK